MSTSNLPFREIHSLIDFLSAAIDSLESPPAKNKTGDQLVTFAVLASVNWMLVELAPFMERDLLVEGMEPGLLLERISGLMVEFETLKMAMTS